MRCRTQSYKSPFHPIRRNTISSQPYRARLSHDPGVEGDGIFRIRPTQGAVVMDGAHPFIILKQQAREYPSPISPEKMDICGLLLVIKAFDRHNPQAPHVSKDVIRTGFPESNDK